MRESAVPVHEFFGAVYGHFFAADGWPGALFEAVHSTLADERYAGLATTLMDHVAGDVEVQWIVEDEQRQAGPSFRMPPARAAA